VIQYPSDLEKAIPPDRCMLGIKKRSRPIGACLGSRSDPARAAVLKAKPQSFVLERSYPTKISFSRPKSRCPFWHSGWHLDGRSNRTAGDGAVLAVIAASSVRVPRARCTIHYHRLSDTVRASRAVRAVRAVRASRVASFLHLQNPSAVDLHSGSESLVRSARAG
jgi:hypothetical protein